MILTIFPLLLKIITIILSFYDEHSNVNDKNYKENNKILIPYAENVWLIPVGIIIYSLLMLLKAYINTKIKWYMDIKYITSHKLLILYGIIRTLFYSIIWKISTFNKCKKEYNSTPNIVDCFCEIQEINEINITNNGIINETTKYLAHYKLYFTRFTDIRESLLEIFAVCLGSASFFFYKYFNLLIIKNLSPIHLMFTIPPFYLIKKLILRAYTYISYRDKFNNKIEKIDSDPIFKAKFILDSFGYFLFIISNLIYFEILELNFCNLNYYLRKSIIERGLLDFYGDDENDILNIFKL